MGRPTSPRTSLEQVAEDALPFVVARDWDSKEVQQGRGQFLLPHRAGLGRSKCYPAAKEQLLLAVVAGAISLQRTRNRSDPGGSQRADRSTVFPLDEQIRHVLESRAPIELARSADPLNRG